MEQNHYKEYISDIIDNNAYCPLDINIIPNTMGINLCSVDSIEWVKRKDGQLVSLNINFIPCEDAEHNEGYKKQDNYWETIIYTLCLFEGKITLTELLNMSLEEISNIRNAKEKYIKMILEYRNKNNNKTSE